MKKDKETLLEIKELSKTFNDSKEKQRVINNISFSVKKNEFISIVGPSGCGKSTLLRLIAGFDNDYTGKILFNPNIINSQKDVGLVFQNYALFPWLNVKGNIAFGLSTNGMKKNNIEKKVNSFLKEIDMLKSSNKYVSQISGGMQQRVAIARTLIIEPKLILMDEPFGSLDSQTRRQMQKFLLKILKKHKCTIIFVTHNIREAVFLSDKVIVLSKEPARIKSIIPTSKVKTETSRLKLEKRISSQLL
jgi:NitT/TauT family transport system ATP-binding protein